MSVKFSFMCMLCRSLFVLFGLFIVLSVLQFMDSDYPFGIFKLFLFSFSKHLLLFKEFKINKIGGTYDTSMLDHLKCTF